MISLPTIRLRKALLLLSALAWALFGAAACSEEPKAGPAAQKLKAELTRDYKSVAPALAAAVASGSPKQALGALDALWTAEEGKNRAFIWAADILDTKGVLFCEHVPPALSAMSSRESKECKDAPGMNMYNYPAVQSALTRDKPKQEVLYLQQGSPYGNRVYVVCWPLEQDGKVVGLFAQAILEDTMQKLGVSEKQFKEIDFSD